MLARFGSTYSYTTVTVSRSASDSKFPRFLFSKTCQDLNRYIVVGGSAAALLSTRAV